MNLTEKIDASIRNVADFPKPGILFKDITPMLENADLCKEIVQEMALYWQGKLDAIAGVESRGFLFGFPLALELNIPFYLVRKKGKLPYTTISQSYDLEYGTAEIEMHTDMVKKGQRILVHDDLLATGGTAKAAAQLIEKQDGKVAGFSFLVELEFLKGKEILSSISSNIHSLIKY